MACMRMRFVHRKILQRNILLQVLLLFLLLMSSSKSLVFKVQGRQAPKHSNATLRKFQYEEKGLSMRLVIGSKPPRCERRCENCAPCEAVQVPIASSSIRFSHQEIINGNNIVISYYSRGADISNYKPMCWKCKCGDFIFNP